MTNYSDTVTRRSGIRERNIAVDIDSYIEGGIKIIRLEKECQWGNLYLAQKDNKDYVIKVYADSTAQKVITGNILDIHSNRLLTASDFGSIKDYYFEAFPFIRGGTLEGKKITDIETIIKIVTQINEALHDIHSAGLTHGDIKPANIFWNTVSKEIIIGDFEAATRREEGYLVHDILGTLEYSAPCNTSLHSAEKTPAYDYGSLGITILDIYTGYVHFAGKTEQEILNEWRNGIILPEQLPVRLRQLIKGLLEQNEEKRFGYNEVVRWCGNGIVNNKDEAGEKKQHTKAMVFGFDGGCTIKVNDLEELAACLLQYKQLAKQRFFNSPNSLERLLDFVKGFDIEKASKIKEIVKNNDIDSAIFMTANLLHKTETLSFSGKYYSGLGELINELSFQEVNVEFVSFVKNGSLGYYLNNSGNDRVAEIIEEMMAEAKGEDDYLYYLIKYRFSSDCNILSINGREISTIENLCSFLGEDGFNTLEKAGNYAKVCAWLYKIGYSEYISKMKEAIRKYE
jgi:serine/threonine protein kinase